MKRIYFHIALIALAAAAGAAKPGWAGMDWKDTTLKYGRWDFRIRLNYAPNCCECFYLMDNEPDPKKHWEEVDVEMVGKNMQTVETYAHCFLNTQPWFGQHYKFPFRLDSAYHTYSLEWAPKYVAWGMDGKMYRKAEETADGKVRDRSFSTSNPSQVTKDTTYSKNWIKRLRDSASMEMQVRFWAAGPDLAGWAGNWTNDNAGKAMFVSWYKCFSYAPGQGENGSDFKLSGYDDFKGTAVDTTKWMLFSWAYKDVVVRDGKCLLVMNWDTVDGYAGSVPADPGDTMKFDQVPVQSTYGNDRESTVKYTNGQISFSTTIPGRVNFSLYDLQGRLVLKVYDAEKAAGKHAIRLNRATMPVGSSVAVLRTPSYRTIWNMARPIR